MPDQGQPHREKIAAGPPQAAARGDGVGKKADGGRPAQGARDDLIVAHGDEAASLEFLKDDGANEHIGIVEHHVVGFPPDRAFPERAALPDCIETLLRQTDAPDEIMIIDDGSMDATIAFLQSRYGVLFQGAFGRSEQYPSVRVLKKPHTGKSRSLNAAWPRLVSDVVVTIDADTTLEPTAISALRREFQADKNLAAACGVISPRCRPSVGGYCFEVFQRFEYIRTYLTRLAWMRNDALLMVPGALGAYRTEALRRVGGFDPDNLVEDYEIIHRFFRWYYDHGRPINVKVIADARAITDAPDGARAFLKQRQRWFAGFLQTQFKNLDMIGNPAYGPVGSFLLPIKAATALLAAVLEPFAFRLLRYAAALSGWIGFLEGTSD